MIANPQYKSSVTHRKLTKRGAEVVKVEEHVDRDHPDNSFEILTYENGRRFMFDNAVATELTEMG